MRKIGQGGYAVMVDVPGQIIWTEQTQKTGCEMERAKGVYVGVLHGGRAESC